MSKVIRITDPEKICKSLGCNEPRASRKQKDSKKPVLCDRCEKCLEKHRLECKVSNLATKKKLQDYNKLVEINVKLQKEIEECKKELAKKQKK
jgi:hypothetical protein